MINAKLTGRDTPLLSTTELASAKTVNLLINKGAEVNVKGFDGSTPLDSARFHPEVPDLLRKHGAKTKKELEAAGN